jgi:hypothetical protein
MNLLLVTPGFLVGGWASRAAVTPRWSGCGLGRLPIRLKYAERSRLKMTTEKIANASVGAEPAIPVGRGDHILDPVST